MSPRSPLLAVALTACACSGRPVRVPTVDRGPGPSAAQDPLGAALHRDVARRGGAMEYVGAPLRGTLEPDGTSERNLVLEAGYCYGVFARVDDAAGELALRIVDSNHDPRQLDDERGPAATLGLREPLCPEPTTEYRLELRAMHPGRFAVRVLRASTL